MLVFHFKIISDLIAGNENNRSLKWQLLQVQGKEKQDFKHNDVTAIYFTFCYIANMLCFVFVLQ